MARAETHQRRQQALKLLGDGYGTSEAVSHLSETWGCSRRTAQHRDMSFSHMPNWWQT